MTLRHQAPAGPHPANSKSPVRTSRVHQSWSPSKPKGINLAPDAPMLTAPVSSHHSLPPIDRHGQTTSSYDFLPSVSFDDLHASIESASADLKLKSPEPAAEGSIHDIKDMADRKLTSQRPPTTQNTVQPRTVNPAVTTRTGRSGSILRGSSSSRHPSTSSIISSSSSTLEASAASTTSRSRRQSQYPPISNTNIASKPPRKSIGPGIIGDAHLDKRGLSSRPSLLSNRASGDSSRRSFDNFSVSDGTPGATSSRAAKAKFVQPPAGPNLASPLAAPGPDPDHKRMSTAGPCSSRVGGRSLPLSASGKRASVMPGAHHPSHATGLGARTISPTDTRRMQRLSTMPQSQSLNAILKIPPPPPPVSMEIRASSKSSSMIPRRTSATPSSARTTPDASNRKSYSSGMSVGSSMSYNTMRTSSASLQPWLSHSSLSRLPAPKHTATHNSAPAEEVEDVPPVPAIPKAFESPKYSPAELSFSERRKISLSAADSLGGCGNFPRTIFASSQPELTKASSNKASAWKASIAPVTSTEEDRSSVQARKQLQPLRLPPLNIGPLNPLTAAKVAALQDFTSSGREFSPPPSRQLPKTPSTPMTASTSTFFSKSAYDETIEMPCLRSKSTINPTYGVTPTPPDVGSSDSSLSAFAKKQKANMSPFLSLSLPKGGLEHGPLQRSKTGGDHHTLTGHEFDDAILRKDLGPVSNDEDKLPSNSPPPDPVAENPRSPSSINLIRHKLSLSWKRGGSKSGFVVPIDTADNNTTMKQNVRRETMPPPRIPTSVTTSNLSVTKRRDPSPNITSNGVYLESRRRKSSVASLTAHTTHDRIKNDQWSKKKDVGDSVTLPVTQRSTAVKNRILKPKSSPKSSLGIFSNTAYSATDLDRDDLTAEDEMRKLGSRRKETDIAARALDALRKRATKKECVSPHEAIRIAVLNIYERGEIIDFEDIYFCGTQNASKVVGDVQSDIPNFGYDDERGDYTIVPGDHLAYRYEIIDIIGKGSFGQVVRCIDHKLGVLVAVKIIRNKKRFHQQALVEVNILQKLREWDPKNRHSMVNFTQNFYFRGHLCISTELLDMNLYEFIKAHSFRGFSLRIIRRFTKQILSSLVLLKKRRVIHCDLKPENILLRHPLHSEIKVIDFGSSCFENEKVYTYIQSRFYRSPEVILGMTYGMPIDMWSVGCILSELYTGVPIFPGENEQEQLACIMEVFGPPEKHLIEKSTRRKLFFDSVGKPRLTVSSKGRRCLPSSKTLQQALKCDDDTFVDFLSCCLRWDPERRMKPEEAIRHEFISG